MFTEIEQYPDYLEALLRGDRKRCREIVEDLLESGLDVKSLYVDLFQRALYKVGELWEQNEISVDVEHYATAITDSLFPLVYPKIFMAEHNGRKAVVSCTVNEYHQIGGKMVADILEMNGWDTRFLGANSSAEDLDAEIVRQYPDMLVLSLSIAQNLDLLVEAAAGLREDYPDLPILAGGQAFRFLEENVFDHVPDVTLVRSLGELEVFIERFN
jgi:MerR family transcriptional regulator, light-induced transcriptional regulator